MVLWTKKIATLEVALGELVLVVLSVIFIYEASGIQFILPIFFFSLLGLFVVIGLFLVTEVIKEGKLTKFGMKKRLNTLVTEEKEVILSLYLFTLLSILVVLIYAAYGSLNIILILLILFACFIVLIMLQSIFRYMLRKQNLVKHISIVFKQHKRGMCIFVFLFLALIIITSVNEYAYSLQNVVIKPKQIDNVKILPFPHGTKTIFIATNDDAGMPYSNSSKFLELINLHEKYSIPGTFFFVAKGLEKKEWVDAVKYGIEKNQEFAFHAYVHKPFEFGQIYFFIKSPSYKTQKESFGKSLALFKDKLNYTLKGFRPPIWMHNTYTEQLLREYNFSYIGSKPLILTPNFPFYRKSDNSIQKLILIPAGGEFTWLYGPNFLKKFQFEFNIRILSILLKKHKVDGTPWIYVSHANRLEHPLTLEMYRQLLEIVTNDTEVGLMNMAEYDLWVRNYEKVNIKNSDDKIIIENAFPSLVIEYDGKKYEIEQLGTFELEVNQSELSIEA